MQNLQRIHYKRSYEQMLIQLPICNQQLILQVKNHLKDIFDLLLQPILDNQKLQYNLNFLGQYLTQNSILLNFSCPQEIIQLSLQLLMNSQLTQDSLSILILVLSQCSTIQYKYSNEIINSDLLNLLHSKQNNFQFDALQAYCKLLFNLLNDFKQIENIAFQFLQQNYENTRLASLYSWALYIFSKSYSYEYHEGLFKLISKFLQKNSIRFQISFSLSIPRQDKVISFISSTFINIVKQYGAQIFSIYQLLPLIYKFLYFKQIQVQTIVLISNIVIEYEKLNIHELQQYLSELILTRNYDLTINALNLIKVSLEYDIPINLFEFLFDQLNFITKEDQLDCILSIFEYSSIQLNKQQVQDTVYSLKKKFTSLQNKIEKFYKQSKQQ